MKFLLDQCTDARLLTYLKQLGHDASQIRRTYPQSIPDPEILSIARHEKRILITDDRDFGELIFRLQLPHAGVIFLRLGTYAPLDLKIERLSYVLTHYADQLDQFLVVKRGSIRVGRSEQEE
jgi:predicted nuclease of predicted toxin-antitoxin system